MKIKWISWDESEKLEHNWSSVPKCNVSKLHEKYYKELVDYCVENKVFFTDNQHQSSIFKAVPLFDDKLPMSFSLRSWSGLMSEVWNKILGTDYNYLSFYCGNTPIEVSTFLSKNKKS